MRTGLVLDKRFHEHVPPVAPSDGGHGHAERPARLDSVERSLDDAGFTARAIRVPARLATRAELEGAHDGAYLDALEARIGAGDASGWFDADTYYSPGTWTAARLASGAVTDLARAVLSGTLDNGFAAVRPPGHHATRKRAMGFCLLNHVAVAAAALRDAGARVAIVDFDVHHGNGTQDIFWEDGRVLYASTHEWPLYPGTGSSAERGAGAGLGTTVNVPLEQGSGDAELLWAYDAVILPDVRRFAPDILLVSAGYDAHRDDPLASLRVSDEGYEQLTRRLLDVAGGRCVFALEGGYDLRALGRCVARSVSVLLGGAAHAEASAGGGGAVAGNEAAEP